MNSVVNIDRHKGIGGSDSGILMQESLSGIHNLWLLKTQRKEPDDLSDVLPVQMGVLTEDFNRSWFTKQTGIETEPYPGVIVDGFRYAHFDGVTLPHQKEIIECKHTNAFNTMRKVKTKYYAQIQHYLLLSKLDTCYLSVFFGNMKWEFVPIKKNLQYQIELLKRQELFWELVDKDEEPTEDNTSWRLYE